jgi:RsiW-degrading membrane proteinase PrsW (M82 family)
MDISAPLILMLLICAAALPVFFIYLWFRLSRAPLSLPWFLICLLAGILSLFIALVFQSFFPGADRPLPGRSPLLRVFIRIAFTEELSRLVVLFPLFWIFRRLAWDLPFRRRGAESAREAGADENAAAGYGAATGLVVGLGFALIEGASYGAANMGIALLRAFTSAPLHGACGARVGFAASCIKSRPVPAILRFFAAVAIHGMYNLMIILPGFPFVLAILAAITALASSMAGIRGELKG